jgi:hypothetical protein
MRNRSSILAIALGVLFLTGCVMVTPQPETSPLTAATPAPVATMMSSPEPMSATSTTQPQVVTDPANAILLGKVFPKDGNDPKPLPGTAMWLAKVHWNADRTDGAFLLDGATSPSATIKDDNSFAFTNVPPGDYAIIVGDPMGMNAIVMEPGGKAKVVTLEAGKTLDVGKLEVAMTASK